MVYIRTLATLHAILTSFLKARFTITLAPPRCQPLPVHLLLPTELANTVIKTASAARAL